ncbi:hypothetical protein TCCBUS3UF1_1200 [Thermus sp. CCB_US3_UF1]|uniref:hypothetical protein n=1 Tax=Thermus sp. CCB_US3_UF1 TaxID=1111069 RepID=UPI000238957B|nr:hypothetical protein [Thermus sp. CCB_US3_UF1]AEV15170.1 hypothetical protein TCCBUS3UF1_1200 [Thermus sp. CCB_US3_UF1]
MKRGAWQVYEEVLRAAQGLGLEGEEGEVVQGLLALPREAFRTFAQGLGLKPKYLRHDLLPVAFLPEPLREALRAGLPLWHAHRLNRLLRAGRLALEDLQGRPPEALKALPREEGGVDLGAPVWLYPEDPRPEALAPGVARALVALYSLPGELVVDPMAGYGTVVEEALGLGRRAWGGDTCPKGPRVERADIRDLPRRFQGEAALLVLHPPTFASWLKEEGEKAPPEERYAAYVEYLQGLLDYALPALRPGGRLVLVVRPRHALSPREWAMGRDFFLSPFERALAEVSPRLRPFHYHLAVRRDGGEAWHLFVAEVGDGGLGG